MNGFYWRKERYGCRGEKAFLMPFRTCHLFEIMKLFGVGTVQILKRLMCARVRVRMCMGTIYRSLFLFLRKDKEKERGKRNGTVRGTAMERFLV